MINQHEVPAFITDRLPEISSDMKQALCAGNTQAIPVYKSIQVLADFTRRMAVEHNFSMVKKCMKLVDRIYEKGNQAVQLAVENVFVFSFSSLIGSCNLLECRIMQSYMPVRLYTLYVQQVLKSNN